MPQELALFMQDDKGPLWQAYFDDVDEAKRQCKELAQRTSVECFVYCFRTFTEIARCRPVPDPKYEN
jgi:hypothetical protein